MSTRVLSPLARHVETVQVQRQPDLTLPVPEWKSIGALQVKFKGWGDTGDTGQDLSSCWWTLDVRALEVTRAAIQGRQTLLGGSAIRSSGIPGTQLKVALSTERNVDIFDVGQGMRVSVQGTTVSAVFLVPGRNAKQYSSAVPVPGVGLDLQEGQAVADCLLQASIVAGESPLGERLATDTRTYSGADTDIPADNTPQPGDYLIPGRARTFTPSSGTAPPVGILQFLDNTIDRNVIESVDLDAVQAGVAIARPGNAGIINLAGVDPDTLPLTVTWGLEL